jgi:hypothetical protein
MVNNLYTTWKESERNFPSVPVRIILIDMPLDSTDYSIEERTKIHEEHERRMEKIKSTIARLGI